MLKITRWVSLQTGMRSSLRIAHCNSMSICSDPLGKREEQGEEGKVFYNGKSDETARPPPHRSAHCCKISSPAEELRCRNESIKDSRKFPSLLSKGGWSQESECYQVTGLKRWDLIDSCCRAACRGALAQYRSFS